ncbi:MAG TPA: zf-HC2 domain-containing protein [Blastocatellia bacterium]
MNVIKFEPNDCRKTREYLDYYISNELATEAAHEVMKHLERCERCSEELRTRQQVKISLQRALLRDTIPPDLQTKVKKSLHQSSSHRSWIMTIAAMFILGVGVWGAFRLWSGREEAGGPRASFSNADILKVGLGDHLHCAIDAGFANRQFTDQEMAAKLGDEFAELASLVKEKIPAIDYRVTIGHRCKYNDRRFVHLILKNERASVSLIVTQKNGESFSQKDASDFMRASGIAIYQSRVEDFEVAGFETRDYLAFVVSNLPRDKNSLIAMTLAPAVRDYLESRI